MAKVGVLRQAEVEFACKVHLLCVPLQIITLFCAFCVAKNVIRICFLRFSPLQRRADELFAEGAFHIGVVVQRRV